MKFHVSYEKQQLLPHETFSISAAKSLSIKERLYKLNFVEISFSRKASKYVICMVASDSVCLLHFSETKSIHLKKSCYHRHKGIVRDSNISVAS